MDAIKISDGNSKAAAAETIRIREVNISKDDSSRKAASNCFIGTRQRKCID